jgi:hypothetical protein
MSGDLILAIAAAAAGPADAPSLVDRGVVSEPAPVVYDHALSLSIPSTDGMRGAAITYERWFGEPRVAIGITGALRETAAADYTALQLGAGVHLRRFWRADAWLSKLPAGSPVGWFYGGGANVSSTLTHDDTDDEWLGTAMRVGAFAEVGYRIAPWRRLVVTPTIGIEAHGDFDISGRLDPLRAGGLTAGLEVGWLF